MAIIGLSILIASITYFCYHRTSFTSSLLQWFHRSAPAAIAPSTELDNVTKQPENEKISRTDSHAQVDIPIIKSADEEMKRKEAPSDEDARSMPPPPPPFRKPSSPTTPRATSITTTTAAPIPSFSLAPSPPKISQLEHNEGDEEDERDNLPPPSFPALNSAQRAQGPRLNPSPSLTPSQPLNRSPGLMAPPSRSLPLPNRGPAPRAAGGGLAPPPTHSTIPAKPKKRVLLTPGHSPLDWARLTSSREFLASQPSKLQRIPPSILKMHNGRRRKVVLPSGETTYVVAEAWTVLGGKVYNMTPYLPYHPGGEPELLRVAGKDGTRLFGEVHPWVNYEGMLEACLVGIAVEESEAEKIKGTTVVGNGLEDMD